MDDERMMPPSERQDELMEVNHVHTLADVVDAHADTRFDLNVSTDGLDTSLLEHDNGLKDVVGYAGNFSNDGLGGATVDDALAPEYDDEDMMAGEYGPPGSGPGDDMMEDILHPLEQSASLDEEAVLSGGVGAVRPVPALPTGFQIENIGEGSDNSRLINEDEPDFSVEDAATGLVTPASARGLHGAEDEDDIHDADVTAGT